MTGLSCRTMGPLLLLVAACGLATASAARPTVLVYADHDLIDLVNWESGLGQQLYSMGVDIVMDTAGSLSGLEKASVLLVPEQNGHAWVSKQADIDKVSKFLARGGLIITLDAKLGPAAILDLVSESLSLEGQSAVVAGISTCYRRRQLSLLR